MDRGIIYSGQVPLETDLLNAQKDAMVGLGVLARAVLGTNTVVEGLACTANSPAALNVLVAPGSIYAVEAADSSAYSSLNADAMQIVKQGILKATQTLTCAAPTSAGQSINYLISAAFVEQDVGLTLLPYYNSANPSQPFSGPANNNTPQATVRQNLCNIVATAGAAATTGSQTTPSAPSGAVGLYVVTVAYGQTTITSGNITTLGSAPFIPTPLPNIVQGFQNLVQLSGIGNLIVPAGVYRIKVRRMRGGGAGGGGTLAGTAATSAGGGGAGEKAEGYLAVTPGQSIAYSVGAGGTAGAASAGGNGGTTTFGSNTCLGGVGGAYANTNPGFTLGGKGGSGGTGTLLHFPGENGLTGLYAGSPLNNWYGGNGASCEDGQGGIGSINGTGGSAAVGFGSGGGGGSGSTNGYAGAPGTILLEY